jgi:hypothetical protein
MTPAALLPACEDVRAAARALRLVLEEQERLPDLAVEVRLGGAPGGWNIKKGGADLPPFFLKTCSV